MHQKVAVIVSGYILDFFLHPTGESELNSVLVSRNQINPE